MSNIVQIINVQLNTEGSVVIDVGIVKTLIDKFALQNQRN